MRTNDHGEIRIPTIRIGGLPVAVLDRTTTAKVTIAAALSRRGSGAACLFFTATNGQVVSVCASSPHFRALFLSADLISADGMSIVFASRLRASMSLPERVATTDNFHDVARLAVKVGASFFFLGATEEQNAKAVENVRKLYPGLRIAGRRNGYFRTGEERDIVDVVNAAAPDILWVGFGAPRQEEFIYTYRHQLTSVGVAKSCGGLFDFLSGKSKRAPRRIQLMGLEWAYRMWQEPRRLGWRYLTTNAHAIYTLLLTTSDDMSDAAIRIDPGI